MRRRSDLIAIIALVVLATIFFADVLIGVNNFYMRDLTRYYYPAKQILREIVRGGEFPYWNRYFSGGQPIAANPEHEVFYPLTWLILLPSYDFGYRLQILLHIYIGLLGMYALLRSMEIRPYASFFGALSFGLGGLYLSYVNLLPILFCAAWLPLTCLFVRRFLLQHRLRDFALSALFLGLQFLVAEPTTIMQTGLLIGLYALYRAWYSTPRVMKATTRVLWIAFISVCGLIVGAAQILPAIDHVHDSARSRPFDWDLVKAWSMPWAKYAELIYPNFLGHLCVKHVTWYWGGGLYPGMGSPFLYSIYSGILVIALAIGGAFIRPRGGRFVLIVAAISSVLALGGHTPLLEWLYKSHILASIRYPEKFASMGVFAMIIFASQMLDRLLDGDDALRDGALGFLLAATSLAALIAGISFSPLFAKGFMKLWGMTPGGGPNYEVGLARIDWWVAFARGMIACTLLTFVRMKRREVWLALTALFVAADLGYVTAELNPREPRRFFEPPPVAKTLPANRADYRVFHEADWYGQEKIATQYFSTGAAVYWVVRNGLFPMTPAGAQVRTVLERDYDKTALLPTIDLTDSVWDVKRSGRADWYQPFMAMSNAWFRGVYRNFDDEKKRNHGDFFQSLPIRFEEAKHYPRYYFADQIVTIKDRSEFVKDLSDNSYSDAVAFVSRPTFVPAKGIVQRVVETANTATLDVESFGQGFLVMSITPHKYWRIRVDGRATPAVVTNIAYQGIVLTPGRHHVEMIYRNELVMVGLWVSVAAIGILLVIAVFARPNRAARVEAYEEPVHVIADATGTHTEPAG